jgi:hypothetical protein
LSFRFEPGFEIKGGFNGRIKQLLNARKRAAGRSGSSLNCLVGAIEIIPSQRLNIRTKNQVRVALPYLELMLLGCVDRPANHLEYIGRGAAAAIFDADRYADDAAGSKFACGTRGHRRDKSSIRKTSGSNLHRLEQPGKSAACADCVGQISVGEDDGLTAREVSCYHGHGNRQIFKAPGFEYPLDQITQPVIAGEAQTGNAPSSDITEANGAACGHDAGKRRAAGICGPEYAADACAGDIGDRDAILLKDLQNAKVSETARKAAA